VRCSEECKRCRRKGSCELRLQACQEQSTRYCISRRFNAEDIASDVVNGSQRCNNGDVDYEVGQQLYATAVRNSYTVSSGEKDLGCRGPM
jgi:hypothetical protein